MTETATGIRRRRMWRVMACGLAVASMLLGLGDRADAAGQAVRFAHWVPTTHALHQGVEDWAKAVTAESKGTLEVQVFPAEQLGKARDHYDMVASGIADLALVVPGYTPGRFPVVSVLELPFLVPSAAQAAAPFDSWYRPLASREMPEVTYCLGIVQEPGILHSRKPVVVPEDVEGMKLRPGSALVGRLFASMGASAVSISAPEAREAAARGVIDAATLAYGTLVSFGLDKVLNNHMDLPLYSVPVLYLANTRWYQGLSGDARAAVDAHCSVADAVRQSTAWGDWERAGRGVLAALPNQTFTNPDAAQRALWAETGKPFRAQWIADAGAKGVDGAAALAELEAAIAAAAPPVPR
ncbi:TRAP transporter substrate-binding protein [Tistrella mobilis]|uniref:TRAP transporter substrate-binding protein n=1 Tax=Tistrella mobilis TaxID=171437 RepID=UPI0035580528